MSNLLRRGSRIVGVAAGAVAISKFVAAGNVPLTLAIGAEQRTFNTARAGRLSYYADDSAEGRPLLLIHSINAAPSSHEMRPLFERYRAQRPVYALDLPGFGYSERSDRVYSIDLYVAAIVDCLREIGGESADVVALSLSCEFAAKAAVEFPELFNTLTLISPSGLRNYPATPPTDLLYNLFSFPLWSQSFYDLLTTQRSINYFLGRQFIGEPPQCFLDYAYTTSHQPGARYAPFYFVSGNLFNYEVTDTVYKRLSVPTLMIYDRDPNVSFDRLPELLAQNERWQAVRIAPTLGLPHWEKLDAVANALADHWGS